MAAPDTWPWFRPVLVRLTNGSYRAHFRNRDGQVDLSMAAPDEGPRRVGYCIHCRGLCHGVTAACELRVWEDGRLPGGDRA